MRSRDNKGIDRLAVHPFNHQYELTVCGVDLYLICESSKVYLSGEPISIPDVPGGGEKLRLTIEK